MNMIFFLIKTTLFSDNSQYEDQSILGTCIDLQNKASICIFRFTDPHNLLKWK